MSSKIRKASKIKVGKMYRAHLGKTDEIYIIIPTETGNQGIQAKEIDHDVPITEEEIAKAEVRILQLTDYGVIPCIGDNGKFWHHTNWLERITMHTKPVKKQWKTARGKIMELVAQYEGQRRYNNYASLDTTGILNDAEKQGMGRDKALRLLNDVLKELDKTEYESCPLYLVGTRSFLFLTFFKYSTVRPKWKAKMYYSPPLRGGVGRMPGRLR